MLDIGKPDMSAPASVLRWDWTLIGYGDDLARCLARNGLRHDHSLKLERLARVLAQKAATSRSRLAMAHLTVSLPGEVANIAW
jgi:hypothetical protein